MLGQEMTYSTFGTNLRQRREAAGITGNQLAKLAEIDQSRLSKIERGVLGMSKAEMDRMVQKVPELQTTVDELKAWAAADKVRKELGDSGMNALWKTAASPLVRIEAAGREIERLVEEKRALVQGPKTPEAVKRAGEIDALLLALENYLGEEGAKLEAEKRRRESS